jgi:hypothetical protein
LETTGQIAITTQKLISLSGRATRGFCLGTISASTIEASMTQHGTSVDTYLIEAKIQTKIIGGI